MIDSAHDRAMTRPMSFTVASRPYNHMAAPRPTTTACRIRGPIAPSDVGGVGARVRALLEESGAQVALLSFDAHVEADLATVDALARAQLQAGRLGCSVALRDGPQALRDVIELAGLAGVLGLEPRREAEEREELLGVEEERELGDPAR
jgi:hypothetical protein